VPPEFTLLRDRPEPLTFCPNCRASFRSFLRGMVHSAWRKWFRRHYCAIICSTCKEIVGYEKP
jgi:hypothetical protein